MQEEIERQDNQGVLPVSLEKEHVVVGKPVLYDLEALPILTGLDLCKVVAVCGDLDIAAEGTATGT